MPEPSFLITLYLAQCCIALVAAALIGRLNQGLSYQYLGYWAFSMYLFAGLLAISGLEQYIVAISTEADSFSKALPLLVQCLDYMRIYFLLIGVLIVTKIVEPGRNLHFICALVIATLVIAASFAFTSQTQFIARMFITGIVLILSAFIFYKQMKHRSEAILLAISLAIFGLIQQAYALESLGYSIGSPELNWANGLSLIGLPAQAFVAFAMLSWAINDEHKKLEENEEKLDKVALYDHLTGLLNRRGLDEQFSGEVSQLSAFVFFDLDRFKKVNDTYGHETGDWLLVAVSRLLQSASGKTDLACRLGGDEFIWVVDAADGKSATLRRIQDFRESVANMNMVNGVPVSISCSIGVSWFPEDAEDLGELTRQSDQALYEAKERGKNRIVEYS